MEKTELKDQNKIINEVGDADLCCGIYEEITAQETGHRFSLRSTDEARELIGDYICHEGK